MEKIKRILLKNKKITRIAVLVKRYCVRLIMLCFRVKPLQKNKVVFISFSGRGFGDNGKGVALKLKEMYPDADIVWATKDGSEKSLPDGIRSVAYQSPGFYKEMATATVWLNNCRMNSEIIKRRGQYYIQLWHGGVPLKKIERDTEKTLEKTYIEHAVYDSRLADIVISGCDYFTDIVKKSFWYSGEVLQCGTPRLDTMFNIPETAADEIKEKAGLPADKRIILYVPTFRADLSTDCYKIDFELVLSVLEQKTGDDWTFAVRLHPNVSDRAGFTAYSHRIINVTGYPDLYELLPFADIVVSDYSSVIFEAGMINKPVFLFATDLSEYKKDRDLYFELDSLPFVFASDNKELIEKIKAFDASAYDISIKAFNKKMNYHENGNASVIIAERIIQHIKNG